MQNKTILHLENAVRVLAQEDDIAIMSFESKANCASSLVLDGIQQAINIAEKSFQGIVIWQESDKFFCVGADLPAICDLVKARKTTAIQQYLTKFQQTALALRYAKIPVVAAVRGYALGGGCELMMHCDQVVTTTNSRIGLVESAIGLLPCGGGTKEMMLRANGIQNKIEQHFLQIARGLFSNNATEAKEFDYLRASDEIISHEEELLLQAILAVKRLAQNYGPPAPPYIKISNEKNFDLKELYHHANPNYSMHDDYVCQQIINIFSPTENKLEYTENDLLKYEITSFMNLVMNQKTIERIEYTLKTGKHLHN